MIRLVYSAPRAKSRTVDDEAMGWVVRLTSGDTSPEDHDAFRRWRDASPEHLEALKRARLTWQQLGAALPELDRRRNRRRHRIATLWRAGPIAASLLLSGVLGNHYWTVGRFDQVTARGERREVVLTDGTRVTMSGDTAFNVVASQGVRRIDLARGEIYVQARHDEAIPLVVYAGQARFRDVGTVFDVRRVTGGAQLVVEEGLVEASRDDRRTIVARGQGIIIDNTVGPLHYADVRTETAWISGRLILRNKTLPQILEALAPYYRGRIVLLRSTDGPLLNATIDLTHIDAWLTALEQMQGLRATHLAGYTFLR